MSIEKEKYNKYLKIIIIPIVICILIVGCYTFSCLTKTEVILSDNLDIEIGTEAYLMSYVKEIKNAKIISSDKKIDTTTLGEKELVIKLKKWNKEFLYKFTVNIIDTNAPIIESEEVIKTYLNNEINIIEKIKITDNSNEVIEPNIKGEYDINKMGEYKLTIEATDASKNTSIKDIKLIVEKDPNNYTFTTTKGFKGEVKDGITYIEGTLIANKSYSLPSNYGDGITKETNTAFNKMVTSAKKEGLNIYITSGFRSYKTQNTIYNNYVKEDGKENADTYSARPGHSEHQTGLAIDINQIKESFGQTKEGLWISDNCYKYGFILRYPKGKQEITGYIYEPWHLRYVGVELATKLYNNGNWLTLEEYYGIDSKYSE